jgi:hypothetical protein
MFDMPKEEDTTENQDDIFKFSEALDDPKTLPCPRCSYVPQGYSSTNPYESEEELDGDDRC